MGDKAWICICLTLLLVFTSDAPDEAPYAFIHLKKVALQNKDTERLSLTLVGRKGLPDEASSEITSPSGCGSPNITIVFLPPDGRWQEFQVANFDLQLADAGIMEAF